MKVAGQVKRGVLVVVVVVVVVVAVEVIVVTAVCPVLATADSAGCVSLATRFLLDIVSRVRSTVLVAVAVTVTIIVKAADGNSNDVTVLLMMMVMVASCADPRLSDLGFRLIESFVSEEALDRHFWALCCYCIRLVPTTGEAAATCWTTFAAILNPKPQEESDLMNYWSADGPVFALGTEEPLGPGRHCAWLEFRSFRKLGVPYKDPTI